MYKELFEKLRSKNTNNNITILTPNRRLAATLHKLYQKFNQDKLIWETPDILPINSWVQRIWQDYSLSNFDDKPQLLTPMQELYLWKKIIENNNPDLLQTSSTAELARSAWNLLKQWQISFQDPIFTSSQDYVYLQNWCFEFTKICIEKEYLDSSSLIDYLIPLIPTLDLAKNIYLVGFTELSPQTSYFFNQYAKTCGVINFLDLQQNHQSTTRVTFETQEEELTCIALWAKTVLNNYPDRMIACVIPDLDKIRNRVVQIFSEVFSNTNEQMVFNISSGKPLAKFPIINTALQILSLYTSTVSAEKISYLLASPYLGDAETEHVARALLDAQLKILNVHTLNLATFQNTVAALEIYCPLLSACLIKLSHHFAHGSHTFSQWAIHFNELLTIMGWPGERSLNSEEYQIVESWYELLTLFSSLEQLNVPVNYAEAFQQLKELASKNLFQPQSPDAPIQVLGILEAAGIPFDCAWVAGMDDQNWPPMPQPNPLIPKSLQRELNMPHATAHRELTFCTKILQQFTDSTEELVYSYARKLEKLEVNVSPLIKTHQEISLKDLNLLDYRPYYATIFASKNIERIQDDTAPITLTENITELKPLRGGVNIIQQQALCPFKAFAQWRLHAKELQVTVPGLRPIDRGTIVHKILELTWKELKDHHTLVTITQGTLHKLIEQCITIALSTASNNRKHLIKYTELEKLRLKNLVLEWLETEKKRPPFKVLFNETDAKISLNKLTLITRIDRVDELEDGKKLIIDYKTGKTNEITHWFSERPEEPQLPLYSLLDDGNTAGISYAQVYKGNHCFKGITRYSLDIKGLRILPEIKRIEANNWDEQVAQWKKILSQLAEDFYMGVAKVHPKNHEQTCTWCALKPLCRIYEQTN